MLDESIQSYLSRKILFLLVLIGLPVCLIAQEGSDVSVRFNRDSVYAGDLFALIIEMDREQFAQFDVRFPIHPRLHIVSRESVPPRLVEGRYKQKESFILQAVSSGELVLSGFVIELSQGNGKQVITYPDISLNVLPFEADTSNVPAPLPASNKDANRSWFGFGLIILLLAVVMIFGWLIYRSKSNKPMANEPETRKITQQDLESIYQKEKHRLGPEIQSELELFLYSDNYSKKASGRLLKQVQDQLAK